MQYAKPRLTRARAFATPLSALVLVLAFGVRPAAAAPFAYIVNLFPANTVSVIDTYTNQVVGKPIPVAGATQLAVTPDGTHVYVTSYSSASVSVIDTASNKVVGAPIPVGAEPWGIAFTPDGTRAYVSNTGPNTVSVIDTASNSVVADDPDGGSDRWGGRRHSRRDTRLCLMSRLWGDRHGHE
jgi:YVTN family beta-propeller protein